MTKNKLTILLLIGILCFIASWLLLTNITLKNEYAVKNKDIFTQIYISYQFNYINGLWLIPSVLLLVTILLILEVPDNILNKLKKDFNEKLKKDGVFKPRH